jgi:hypothetical protein
MGEHCYTSVPCRRDRHSRCIAVCLYCGALCECECHVPENMAKIIEWFEKVRP